MIKIKKLLEIIRRYEHFILFEFHNLSIFTSEWISDTELKLSNLLNAYLTDDQAAYHVKIVQEKVKQILKIIKDGEDKEFFEKLNNEIKDL